MSTMSAKTSTTPQRLKVYLLGPTGSGKSTAINSLFKRNCAEQASGKGESTTKNVTPYDYLEDKELNFTLYDTPGFPDTQPEHIKTCFDRLIESDEESGKIGMNVTGVDAAIFIIKTDNIANDFWHDLSLLTDELGGLSPDVHRFLLVNVVAGEYADEELKRENGAACGDKVNKILNWCDSTNIIVSTGSGGKDLGRDIKSALTKVKRSSSIQGLQTMGQWLQKRESSVIPMFLGVGDPEIGVSGERPTFCSAPLRSTFSMQEVQDRISSMLPETWEKPSHLRVYLLGPTASGKSTAINSIFGRRCAEQASGMGKSTTKVVNHYDYHDESLRITFYDTPGFPDTEPENTVYSFNQLIESEVDGGKVGMNVTGVDAAVFIIKTDNIANDFWHDLSLLTDELGGLSPDVHRFLLVNVVAGEYADEELKRENGAACGDKVNKILNWCDSTNIIVSTGSGGKSLGLDIKSALTKVKRSSTVQRLQTMDQLLQKYKDAFSSEADALQLIENENKQKIEAYEQGIAKFKRNDDQFRKLNTGLVVVVGVAAVAGVAAAPLTGGLSLTAVAGAGAIEFGRREQKSKQRKKSNELKKTEESLKSAVLYADEARNRARKQGQKFRRLVKFIKDPYEFPAWMNA